MVSKKRSLEDAASPKAKKSKVAADGGTAKKEKKAKSKVDKPLEHILNPVPEEVDFPRGGGTTLTAQEVKAVRAEAIKEADDLFKVRARCCVSNLLLLTCRVKEQEQRSKKLRKKSDAKGKGKAVEGGGKKTNAIRIEHLNYKVCPLRQPSLIYISHISK